MLVVKTSECIAFYETKAKLAEALGIETPSVYGWGEHPPPLRQIQLQGLTAGKLMAEPDVFGARRKEAA